jgi:hypothetical protein
MSAIVSGLDVHKEYTYATILGPDGEKLAQGRMPNEKVPAFLKPYRVERVAMEATTSIAPLYRRLTEEGYDVTVSHPKKTQYIAEARIKTDKTSSQALAELLRVNGLLEIALLREKIRRRAFMVRERTKLKVKIRSVLAYEGVKPPEGPWTVHQEGCRVAGGSRIRGGGLLSEADVAPEQGGTRLPLGVQAYGGGRRGHTTADVDSRGRLLYGPLGEGGDRRGESLPLQGEDGQLLRARAQHEEQRRSHQTRPHHQGGEPLAPLGAGGGGPRPPQVRHARHQGVPQDSGEEGP